MTPEREASLRAILEPAAFESEVKKRKTQQNVQDEQIAIYSISQPKAYSTEFEKFKDNDRRQLEKAARDAVLDPVTHSGSVEVLKEEVRKKKARGEAIDEILDPKFLSGNIPGKPAIKAPKKVR